MRRFSRVESILVSGNAVNALGDGMFAATSILFFTTVRGFSTGSVADAMAVAGALALCLGIPIGRSADRLGIRALLVALTTLEGLAVLCYLWTRAFWVFGLVVCVAVVANRTTPGIRNAYIARVSPGPERVQLRALLRSVTNVGLAAGAGVAALILSFDDHASGYGVIFGIDALTFLLSAILYWRAPPQPASSTRQEDLRDVLRNRRFVRAAAGEAVLSLHTQLAQIGLPIWVATRTRLPHAIVPALLALSSLICTIAQLPAARGTASAEGAGRAARRAGLLLALACAAYALAPDHQAWVVVAVLVAATLLRAAGEVTQTASAWGLAFALAPLESVGLYQSFFSTGYTAATIIGPLLWSAAAGRHDPLGWVVAIALFAAAGELAHSAGSKRHERDGRSLTPSEGEGAGLGQPNRTATRKPPVVSTRSDR